MRPHILIMGQAARHLHSDQQIKCPVSDSKRTSSASSSHEELHTLLICHQRSSKVCLFVQPDISYNQIKGSDSSGTNQLREGEPESVLKAAQDKYFRNMIFLEIDQLNLISPHLLHSLHIDAASSCTQDSSAFSPTCGMLYISAL